MCLYSTLIINPKYKPNKKNNGKPPELKDERVKYVPVGCGKCMECKRQKARQWSIRLQEEIRTNKEAEFVTLTFSSESIETLTKVVHKKAMTQLEGYELDNAIAKQGVRHFLERWRKKYGISIKHWLVTELGHNGTENIHLHGLLFKNEYKGYQGLKQQYYNTQKEDITKIWQYGWVYIGDYVNEQTINYISKYITKTDEKHTQYNAKILTSAGIGSKYIERLDAKLNKYKKGQTREYYSTREGTKINLPVYWRNQIYTEDEREQLWIEKLDQQIRYVNGIKIDVSRGTEHYFKVLETQQRRNIDLGYGTKEKNWNKEAYELELRKINQKKRQENLERKREKTTFEDKLIKTQKHGKITKSNKY